jgi:hypothetical protein
VQLSSAVPESIDPVFARKKTPKRSLSVIENKRFGLVFAKTGSINSGTGCRVNQRVQRSSVVSAPGCFTAAPGSHKIILCAIKFFSHAECEELKKFIFA